MENNFSYNPMDLPGEVKKESKHLSFVFFTFAISYLVSLVFILTANAFLYAAHISEKAEYIIRSFLSASHTPLIFFIMYKVFKKGEAVSLPVSDKMNVIKLAGFLFVCIFLMITGSLFGNFASKIISSLTGSSMESIVSDIVKSMKPSEVFILAVIVGPVFEELVFRKLLAGKLLRYGTVFASCVSALVFGLYHGNFEQFFYAFFVGVVLSYVYCVYGKIIYPIIIHIILNAVGSFVPLCLGLGETNEITLLGMIYLCFYIFSFISGGFILLSKFGQAFFGCIGNYAKICSRDVMYNKQYPRHECRLNLIFYITDGCLINPWRALFKAKGFIFAVVISILIFVYNIL